MAYGAKFEENTNNDIWKKKNKKSKTNF
jgi:hypothetical protein